MSITSAAAANEAASTTTTAPGGTAANQSIADNVISTLTAIFNLSADGIAKALGLWTAARAAVSTVASGVAAAAAQATVNAAQAKYQGVPLTPPVLADMIVRNILPDSTGAAGGAPAGYPTPQFSVIDGHNASVEASYSGLDGDRFAAMVADTGESYGILDALRLYNRGQFMYALTPGPNYSTGTPLYVAGSNLAGTYGITQAELDAVIAYSRVRPQFTTDLLKLSKNSLSPADAVELAVKQIVDQATAQSLFEAAGGVAEQFDALVDGAGDSAGVQKSVELEAHGVITPGQLTQIVGMSRMNPRFYYLTVPDSNGTAPLNYKWLPPYEIREAASVGLVTPEQALTWLLQDGYPEDQATVFAQTVAGGMATTVKNETAGMVLEEYQANLLTEDQATAALTNLGYSAASIPFLLQYAQAKQVVAARNTAVSRVRQGFLLSLLTSDQATAELSQVGVPQAAITTYLADWAVELTVPHTNLSAAQIGKLLEGSHISVATAETLWAARGYPQSDMQYLEILYPPPAVGTAPAITSPDVASATVGEAFSFNVTVTGSPTPNLLYTGALPAGLVWQQLASGGAEVFGTPSAGSDGTYHLTLTASNDVGSPASQTLTITVGG